MIKIHTIALILLLVQQPSIVFASAGGDNEKKIVADRTTNLLSQLRSGDFSHIGGLRALNIMLNEVGEVAANSREGASLEIGCGTGGSANYLRNSGYDDIWAIDKKSEAIEHAIESYPEIKFVTADILDLTDEFKEDYFNFIFLINTAIAIKDKNNLWQEIKSISKKGAIMAILDYSLLDHESTGVLVKPDGQERYPILVDETKRIMDYIGWRVLADRDISQDFKQWHLDILRQIDERRQLLISVGFSEGEIKYIQEYYENIVRLIDEAKIGGVVLVVKKV